MGAKIPQQAAFGSLLRHFKGGVPKNAGTPFRRAC
jgi:hypothetical protein